MSTPKKFKWTIELEVAECWVADGFNPTDEMFTECLLGWLGWATESEVKARIVKKPDQEKVARMQGYENAAHMENMP